jgi:hypothetical protein
MLLDMNNQNDSDDSEAEEQSFVAFTNTTTTAFTHSEHNTQFRKLDYGGGRPDDFMGGCGVSPAMVRRKMKATPSWLANNNEPERDLPPKPIRRVHSSDITRPDGPDTRSCVRSHTMDSVMPSLSTRKSIRPPRPQPDVVSSIDVDDTHIAVTTSTSNTTQTTEGAKNTTETSTEEHTEKRRGCSRSKSSQCIGSTKLLTPFTHSLLGSKDNDDDSDSDEEGERRQSSLYKPNDYIGGYKEKNNTRTMSEPERRVLPLRTASYRRPGDFMGGGTIAPENAPRRKSIDPSSIFGKK